MKVAKLLVLLFTVTAAHALVIPITTKQAATIQTPIHQEGKGFLKKYDKDVVLVGQKEAEMLIDGLEKDQKGAVIKVPPGV
ncbi:hypothetical protein HDU79_001298 [Rhizoclosmatium sp. JEL0117]|nr:hypothetical protein HDU79_001298 [Rhizoclosmatium sp. JEL0117]